MVCSAFANDTTSLLRTRPLPESLKAVARYLGFEQAAPIQAEAIPRILAGGTWWASPRLAPGKPPPSRSRAGQIQPGIRGPAGADPVPHRELAVRSARGAQARVLQKPHPRCPSTGGPGYGAPGLPGLRQVLRSSWHPGRIMDPPGSQDAAALVHPHRHPRQGRTRCC